MNLINRLRSKSLRGLTMAAATMFALTVGSSSAFAQRGGGGGGHGGGGGGGHGGGGHMGGGGGGHMGGGGGGHMGGGGGQMGGGHPTGGHPQGMPRPGPVGTTGRSDGRGSNERHPETDHRDHGRDFDHRGHFHDRDHDFDRRFFYYHPFFGGYPYYYYPYYPYQDYGYYSNPTYSYPAETENGGISLAVTPADASVYVDSNYVGTASTFSSGSQPLSLAPGSHRIELQAPGYVPVAFNVNVVAGQVTPYHVSLKPDR